MFTFLKNFHLICYFILFMCIHFSSLFTLYALYIYIMASSCFEGIPQCVNEWVSESLSVFLTFLFFLFFPVLMCQFLPYYINFIIIPQTPVYFLVRDRMEVEPGRMGKGKGKELRSSGKGNHNQDTLYEVKRITMKKTDPIFNEKGWRAKT